MRGIVLAGGGVAGIAWLVGVVTALRDHGVDLGEADSLLGTSAGSVVAALIATDSIDAGAAAQQQSATAERAVSFDFAAFTALAAEASANSSSKQDAARRLAQLPMQQTQVDAEQRRAIVAARLPVQQWPDRDLALVAVDRSSGERVVFRRSDDLPLVDAVAASCAVPGVWPPTVDRGREYVDGGAWSLSNADLAPGLDRLLVLVPVVATDPITAALDDELTVAAAGRSFVLAADEDAGVAFGPNPLDPSTRAAAFAAGRRQGEAAAAAIAGLWRA